MTSRQYLAWFLVLSLAFRITRLIVAIKNSKARGRGFTTAPAMFWVMTVGYVCFLILGGWEGFSRASHFSWAISISGLCLYAAALLLRERAMSDLGRFFSPDIEIRQQHQVVREGLYRHMRHPLLACMGLEIIGVGCVLNAYWTLVVIGIGFYFPLIVIRKTIEEKALLKSLGEAYRSYQEEVWAFFPKKLLPLKIERSH